MEADLDPGPGDNGVPVVPQQITRLPLPRLIQLRAVVAETAAVKPVMTFAHLAALGADASSSSRRRRSNSSRSSKSENLGLGLNTFNKGLQVLKHGN